MHYNSGEVGSRSRAMDPAAPAECDLRAATEADLNLQLLETADGQAHVRGES